MVVVAAVEKLLGEVVGMAEGIGCWAAGVVASPPSMAAMAMPGTAPMTTIEMAARSLCRLDHERIREEGRCRLARELIAEAPRCIPAWRSSPFRTRAGGSTL